LSQKHKFLGFKQNHSEQILVKSSFKDFIIFFGKDRFDNDLTRFIRQFGNYKLKSQSYPDEKTYFAEIGTFSDFYLNEAHGFELIFEDPTFIETMVEENPQNLVLAEIVFYLENLNEKNVEDGFLLRFDTNTMMKQVFPDKVFKGTLPGNIKINDNKQIIAQKLGMPLISDKLNNFDTFFYEENKLIIKVIYHDNSNLIRFLTICPVAYEKAHS
jgi:hypothetical protein